MRNSARVGGEEEEGEILVSVEIDAVSCMYLDLDGNSSCWYCWAGCNWKGVRVVLMLGY